MASLPNIPSRELVNMACDFVSESSTPPFKAKMMTLILERLQVYGKDQCVTTVWFSYCPF